MVEHYNAEQVGRWTLADVEALYGTYLVVHEKIPEQGGRHGWVRNEGVLTSVKPSRDFDGQPSLMILRHNGRGWSWTIGRGVPVSVCREHGDHNGDAGRDCDVYRWPEDTAPDPAADLIAWTNAQLDADERVASAATPGPWSADQAGTVCADVDLVPDGRGGELLPEGGPMEVAECYRNERAGERGHNAAHIARHDPARVLRDVEAKRRILAEHRHSPHPLRPDEIGCDTCHTGQHEYVTAVGLWCNTVRLVALPFAGRRGYRPEWAPGD